MTTLTKADWDNFRKIVREEAEAEVKATEHNLQSQMQTQQSKSQQDLKEIKDRVKTAEILTRSTERKAGIISTNVTKIESRIKVVQDRAEQAQTEMTKGFGRLKRRLDHANTHLDSHFTKRINRLEKEVNLPPLQEN